MIKKGVVACSVLPIIDRIIRNNGLEKFKRHLDQRVWADTSIGKRSDTSRPEVRKRGAAMMSLGCYEVP